MKRECKILIEDIPDIKRDEAHIQQYLNSLMEVPCSVTKYDDKFMAQFSDKIGKTSYKCIIHHTYYVYYIFVFRF